MGIFVCNATYQDNQLEDARFDLVIYIKNDNSSEENQAKIERIFGNKLCIIKGRTSFSKLADDEYRRNVMQLFFTFIKDSEYFLMKEDIEDWNNLLDIFFEYRFIKHRRFAYFRDDKKYATDAKDSFLKMAVSISNLLLNVQKSGRQSRYLDYATLYLAYLINECCSYLRQNFFFDSKKLYDLIQQSAIRYNDFENYYLLMAFLTELDSSQTLKGELCYQTATTKLNGFSYANYAYYRYGRYCEIALKDEGKARDYYVRAYNANPREYRAIYKIGYFAIKDRQYEEAKIYFRKILSLLEGKFKYNILQENEYDYYYKCCKVLENIEISTGDRQMAEYYRGKAEELLKKIKDGSPNQNYVISFNEEAPARLEDTYNRLKGRTVENALRKVKSAINT